MLSDSSFCAHSAYSFDQHESYENQTRFRTFFIIGSRTFAALPVRRKTVDLTRALNVRDMLLTRLLTSHFLGRLKSDRNCHITRDGENLLPRDVTVVLPVADELLSVNPAR
jgi:hypothetical protein